MEVRPPDLAKKLEPLNEKVIPDGVEHLPARREHTQRTPGTAVNYGLSIDQDLKLAVVTVDHLDLDPQLAPQLVRHPGGMQRGDSVSAIPNSDPAHDDLPRPVQASLALDHGRRPRGAPGAIRFLSRNYLVTDALLISSSGIEQDEGGTGRSGYPKNPDCIPLPGSI